MTRRANRNGWIRHFLLTIDLNFGNPQAIAYGYLVPVIFLLAFGSVFRSDSPPLLPQMGQIVTITVLGGACFGLPTALVAERERGIWKRYRLLPVPIASLVLSAMLARVLFVASAVLVQIALARAIFGTPLPAHPADAALAFLFVTAAFLGIGLLIGARRQCARGAGAGTMHLPSDDPDRRRGSAAGGPAPLGAEGRRLHARTLCGGSPATLLQHDDRSPRRFIPIGRPGRDRPRRGAVRNKTIPLGTRPEDWLRALVGGGCLDLMVRCRRHRLGNRPLAACVARAGSLGQHY